MWDGERDWQQERQGWGQTKAWVIRRAKRKSKKKEKQFPIQTSAEHNRTHPYHHGAKILIQTIHCHCKLAIDNPDTCILAQRIVVFPWSLVSQDMSELWSLKLISLAFSNQETKLFFLWNAMNNVLTKWRIALSINIGVLENHWRMVPVLRP